MLRSRLQSGTLNEFTFGVIDMSPNVQTLGIDRLSRDQRIALVLEIWDTVAAEAAQPLLTESQRLELRRRVAEDDASPDEVVPWEQVKAKALARFKQ